MTDSPTPQPNQPPPEPEHPSTTPIVTDVPEQLPPLEAPPISPDEPITDP